MTDAAPIAVKWSPQIAAVRRRAPSVVELRDRLRSPTSKAAAPKPTPSIIEVRTNEASQAIRPGTSKAAMPM